MDEELLAEFLTESNENMASIEEQLLDLESDPANSDRLDGIFRVVHTVKGSCGFLGLSQLEKVAHAGENLLGKIRSTKFAVDSEMVSLLLESTDAIKEIIAGIEEHGREPGLDHSSICERLAVAEGRIDGTPADDEGEVIEEPVSLDWLQGIDEAYVAILRDNFPSPEKVLAAGFGTLRGLPGMQPAIALKVLGIAKSVSLDNQKKELVANPEVLNEVVESGLIEAPKEQVLAPVEEKKAEASISESSVKNQVQPARKAKSEGSIRVDVALLDELMNQVGELVLSRNRLLRLVEQQGGTELVRTSRNISQITSRLQEKLLHTRMQPISNLWGTVPRLLRDITKSLGKRIRVEMEGQETELDRTILAALKDPMTHIIRNSCDHGIESPDVRLRSGKQEEGAIKLKARQESGFIVIDVSDDGGGIDADNIRNKAVSMGVITADQGDLMSDKAALQLIFHAGLSTVEKVSNLSGRGVGMDVVQSAIEGVGGTVEIESRPGQGTTLNIRIPLTLAIIPALIVESATQHFAIPQMMVQELIAIDRESDAWEEIAGKPFYRLRGRLLPIIALSEVLEQQGQDESSSVVVVNIGARQFGISVGVILGAEEIVVKPLGRHFNHLEIYGGCSILGDGRVVPILDCLGLTKGLRQEKDVEAVVANSEAALSSISEESQYILVFAVGEQWYAIPMALVERIEEVEAAAMEKSGRREVLQYRGDVVRVIRLASVLEVESLPEQELEPCLIISDQGSRLCIQVDKIIDIVKQKLEIHLENSEPYFIGTAVVDGRSTEVIDIFEVIKKVAPNWFSSKGDRRQRVQKILYVEDAVFFRNMVIPLLDGLGCEVIAARNGIEAKKILERESPDILLTDLEMPEMDGFALTQWVRTQPRFEKMPIVALSSLDESQYREPPSLFDACVKKLDRGVLLKSLTQLLGRKREDDSVLNAEVILQENNENGGRDE